MYVMGINSVFHESAACLVHDGRIVAASEEERFNRIKHGKKPTLENPDQLPIRAMHHCLETAGIDIRQVAHVGFSSDPQARRRLDSQVDSSEQSVFCENIERVPQLLHQMGFAGRFTWVDHHLAHAASAFYPAPFDDAAVLAIDGIGDDKTTASYFGRQRELQLVSAVAPPHSIGFLWELLSMFLGFDIYDATKIMGLAAYGDPRRYVKQFERIVSKRAGGQFAIDQRVVRFAMLDYQTPTGYFAGLERLFGMRRRAADEDLRAEHMDIAACLQDVTDDVVMHIARHVHEETGSRNLCLAGGVALNCVTNQRVFEQGPFENLFVQPAAHDAGTAVGAASYVWHQVLGNARCAQVSQAYLGPDFSAAEIERELDARKLRYERRDNIERDVARLVSEGNVVGYFQGRMEIGPRALGDRSLLADPRHPGMREILNQKVKHREYFRPFAPSVLEEHAPKWFEIARPTSASDFMLMAYPAAEALRDRIPAVLHVDGTGRVQTVSRQANPRFHRLISEFNELTGVPIVLNTSFNDGEPIVCSPADAVETFLKTRIDYLAVGDFLVAKAENEKVVPDAARSEGPRLERLYPDLSFDRASTPATGRLCRVGGALIVTDRIDAEGAHAVPPLFVDEQFLVDELKRARLSDARVLDIGCGAGARSIVAAQAGAASVVALESDARARQLAKLNARWNHCADRIEFRTNTGGVYRAVEGESFDFVMANPTFSPAPCSGKGDCESAVLGLEELVAILEGLDDHLTTSGMAQIVAVCPGGADGPDPLRDLAAKWLAGRATIKVNPVPRRYVESIAWLRHTGAIDQRQAAGMARAALRRRLTHTHLALIEYERQGPRETCFVRSRNRYEQWHRPTPALEY